METHCSVGEVMSPNPITTEKSRTISEVAKKMAEKKVGCLVVVEGSEVVGIITEQDVARKVVAKQLDPFKTLVKNIMSADIKSIAPDKDIHDAIILMGRNQIKHLPVIASNKLHGVLTFKDVIQIEPALIEHLTLSNRVRSELKD